MELWIADLECERQGPILGLLKAALANPLAKYLSAGMLRGLLCFAKSELAAANWRGSGGWRSMVNGNDRFFRRVFGLHMNHRSPEQLQALMGRAGFGDFTALAEALGVCHVVVGRRAGGPDAPAETEG